MTRQTALRGVFVLLLVLMPAGLALANSGAPVLYLPGLVMISPLWGLPATLAAAVLERPFVSRAGIQRHALTRSIRANLLSWLVGLVISLFMVAFIAAGPKPLGFAAAVVFAIACVICLPVVFSIFVEGGYYVQVLRRDGAILRWRWVIAGNIVSAAFLTSLSFVPDALRREYPQLEFMVEPHREPLWWLLAAISLALVLFALRPLGQRQQVIREAPQFAPMSGLIRWRHH